MSNNLDFKAAYFDGIYSPYKSYHTINHNAVIEEFGYDHRFEMNREEEEQFNETQIDESNLENNFNVISQEDFAELSPFESQPLAEVQELQSATQSNFGYSSETENSVFSYYQNLDYSSDIYEENLEESTQTSNQDSETLSESEIKTLDQLKQKARKIKSIQF
jgi:hypothetical protein